MKTLRNLCFRPLLVAFTTFATGFFSAAYVERCGWVAYVSAVAVALVSITMLVRANDLGWRPGLLWMIRRLGFILAGTAPFAMIYRDWVERGQTMTLYEMVFRVGIALVFVTTPYLPPWWKWAFKGTPSEHDNARWSDDRRGLPRGPSNDAD